MGFNDNIFFHGDNCTGNKYFSLQQLFSGIILWIILMLEVITLNLKVEID